MDWLKSKIFKKVYTFPSGHRVEETQPALAEGGFAYVHVGITWRTAPSSSR